MSPKLLLLKKESHCIGLAGPELAVWARLASSSQGSTCLFLLSVGVKGVKQHARLTQDSWRVAYTVLPVFGSCYSPHLLPPPNLSLPWARSLWGHFRCHLGGHSITLILGILFRVFSPFSTFLIFGFVLLVVVLRFEPKTLQVLSLLWCCFSNFSLSGPHWTSLSLPPNSKLWSCLIALLREHFHLGWAYLPSRLQLPPVGFESQSWLPRPPLHWISNYRANHLVGVVSTTYHHCLYPRSFHLCSSLTA